MIDLEDLGVIMNKPKPPEGEIYTATMIRIPNNETIYRNLYPIRWLIKNRIREILRIPKNDEMSERLTI